MIMDKIENASLYSGLNRRIEIALNYIQHTDFKNIEVGRHDIDSDLVYAMLFEYDTKTESESFLEAHQKYIDVQYMVEGEEIVGYTALDNQKAVKPYNASDDYLLFKEKRCCYGSFHHHCFNRCLGCYCNLG